MGFAPSLLSKSICTFTVESTAQHSLAITLRMALFYPSSRSPLCLSSLAYTCRALKAASHAIAIHSDRSRLIVMRAVSVAVSLV